MQQQSTTLFALLSLSSLIAPSCFGQSATHVTVVAGSTSEQQAIPDSTFGAAGLTNIQEYQIHGTTVWYAEASDLFLSEGSIRLHDFNGSIYGEPTQLLHDLGNVSPDQFAEIEDALNSLRDSLGPIGATQNISTVRVLDPTIQFGLLENLNVERSLHINASGLSTSVLLPAAPGQSETLGRWEFQGDNTSLWLQRREEGTYGVLHTIDRAFVLRPLVSDIHALIELDSEPRPEPEYSEDDRAIDKSNLYFDPLGDVPLDPRSTCDPRRYVQLDPHIVDLGIEYTKEALPIMRAFIGSEEQFVNLSLEIANRAYTSNCLPIALRATIAPVAVPNDLVVRDTDCSSRNFRHELVICARKSIDALKNSSSNTRETFVQRVTSSNRDIIVIIVEKLDIRGRSASIGPDVNARFVIVEASAILSNYFTLLHELAHFQGAEHQSAYVDNTYRTTSIVATENPCCKRRLYFSSSKLYINSKQVGRMPNQDNHFWLYVTAGEVSQLGRHSQSNIGE